MRRAVLAAMLLVLAACGGSPRYTGQSSPSAASPTVSPGATPIAVFPSPTAAGGHPPEAAVTCTSQIPAGHELALVSLRNTAGVHVRDISDLSHPVSRCIFTNGRGTNFRFISATHVSYVA